MNRTAAALLALVLAAAGPAFSEPRFAPIPKAVIADTPRDPAHPADLAAFPLPTGGVNVNAIMYLASGDQPHPTLLFLHGFPGNEPNNDLMQAVRRAGWNVMKINYRGSWGSPGAFSFAHARADSEAAVAFLFDPAVAAKYHIDTSRIVVAGHSMGGFMAADAASAAPKVAGTIMVDAWNIGAVKAQITSPQARAAVTQAFGVNTAPLAGTSAAALVAEVENSGVSLALEPLAARAASRPLLVIGADRGMGAGSTRLAEAARQVGGADVTEVHFDTDHSFSDSRIALAAEIVRWLGRFDPASAKVGTPQIPLHAPYDENNPFARILRGEMVVPKVYEDDQVLAFMDHAPAEPGHVLVISKTSKARNILEISPQDLSRVMAVAAKVGQAEIDGLGVEGFTIVQNNGVGQSVPHLHIHVIPRIAGKPLQFVENAKGDPKDIEATAAKIRAAMK